MEHIYDDGRDRFQHRTMNRIIFSKSRIARKSAIASTIEVLQVPVQVVVFFTTLVKKSLVSPLLRPYDWLYEQ